jgi:lysine 2,3-aminomutase
VKEAHRELQRAGMRIYNQTVLLKGVNDAVSDLVGLFDELRALDVETHYLFHCIPMRGMGHHRTTLQRGLELMRSVANAGVLSGRCKPMYTAMTDVGKITLYEGSILERDDRGRVLLQSHYTLEDRMKWNPHWRLPDSAQIDGDGMMRVWYLDGAAG